MKFADRFRYLLSGVKNEGVDINGTRDLQNVSFKLKRQFDDFEEKEVKQFYDEFIGNYDTKLKSEIKHYNFLYAFMKHKIVETLYFFPKNDMTSRKFVIWSNDCISCVQFLHREGKNTLNVMMRSSDIIKLLPLDIYYMKKLLDEILDEHDIVKNPNDEVNFLVSSLHYYDDDLEIVKKIFNS